MRLPTDPTGLALPDPFDLSGSSFEELLRRRAPEVFARMSEEQQTLGSVTHVHGTTVLALTFGADRQGEGTPDTPPRGVVIAGDRRATSGNVISKRDMRKVFEADSWSAVAISGAAGPAMDLAKIFATELEHYEKVEGGPLSLEGKANKLAQMVRSNLPMALQGLVVVPLFAGFDPGTDTARIYEFDVAGGRFEERRFASSGSGGRDARGSLKARYRPELELDDAVGIALEALWDAADEDAATGGPDIVRRIYPLVAVIDAEGYRELSDDEVERRVQDTIAGRRQ